MADNQEEEAQLRWSPSCDSLFGDADTDIDIGPNSPATSAAQPPWENTPASTTSPQGGVETRLGSSDILPSWLGSDPMTGLSWVKNGLGIYPKWTIPPRIESIVATLKLAMGSDHDYAVQFLHEGALSKLYVVSTGSLAFILRVRLPVNPRAKTESEVATLDWVNQHTSLPVPRVIAYDSSRDNPLGFEWILMSRAEGKSLSESWWSVSLGSKERLVKQIAAFSTEIFEQSFQGGIGSIYKTASGEDGGTHSRLRFATTDLASRLCHIVDENERETLQRMVDLTRRIERLMPKFYPSPQPSADTGMASTRTMLSHDSLSLDNILVNDEGIFTGVVDWQCISCLPVHEACQFPAFLRQTYDRLAEPVMPSYLIGGVPHASYFRALKRWEITRLRRLYVEEMMRRAPGFVNIWRDERSADLRDYEAAVQNCDNEFVIEILEEWVDAMEHGKDPVQLPKRLHECLAG
ncbi:phosphotransferase enzyme family-domain-containing protein [Xylaria digitata]|nr:phosphotransferase enzyme family-domain-containing protein [Xylaria digitata]